MSVDWVVISNWATVAAPVLALFAIWQASMLHTKSKQPYVVVSLAHNQARPEFIEVSIKNYGPTAATDIRLTSHVKPMRPEHIGEAGPQELELYGREWHLAPGQEWRTGWGHIIQLRKVNERKTFCGIAHYIGQGRPWYLLGFKPRHKTEFILDLNAFDDRTRLEEETVHSTGKYVKDILERLGGPTNRKTTRIGGSPVPLDEIDAFLESRNGPHK